jgi:hypothetical protein
MCPLDFLYLSHSSRQNHNTIYIFLSYNHRLAFAEISSRVHNFELCPTSSPVSSLDRCWLSF